MTAAVPRITKLSEMRVTDMLLPKPPEVEVLHYTERSKAVLIEALQDLAELVPLPAEQYKRPGTVEKCIRVHELLDAFGVKPRE